jgi:hypothetical protein
MTATLRSVRCAVRTAALAVVLFSVPALSPRDAAAQPPTPTATLVPSVQVAFSGETDSNSPALWDLVEGTRMLYVLNSVSGRSALSQGRWMGVLGQVGQISWEGAAPLGGAWMESVLADEGGVWYGYYHNELQGLLCPGSPKVIPRIGAARSFDRGLTWQDLGPILDLSLGSPCESRNFYFLGGVGDFSVALDADHRYLYLHYTQYREPDGVGVSVARMPWASRDEPQGTIAVWSGEAWIPAGRLSDDEAERAGIHGPFAYPVATPVMPAGSSWDDDQAAVDVLWGPSVHWNTHLEMWVMLLNRANSNEWGQEGIYVSYNATLEDPGAWSVPVRLLEGGRWYPQVLGTEPGVGTDKQAGRIARFFMSGGSSYLITFTRP